MKQFGRAEFACILILTSAATLLGLPGKANKGISSKCEHREFVLPIPPPRQRPERVRPPRFREAQPAAARDEASITVHVQDYVGLSAQQFKIAEQTAEHILRQAGVEIIWLDYSPGMAEALGPGTLVLRILPESMARCIDRSSKVLGGAHLTAAGGHGIFVSIFFDRVQELANTVPSAISEGLRCARLLGSVMAHELAHLFGNGHTSLGIMRYPWRSVEIYEATKGTLDFRSVEVERIRDQVKDRLYAAGDGD